MGLLTPQPVRVQVLHADPLMSAGLLSVLRQRDEVRVVDENADVIVADYQRALSLVRLSSAGAPRIVIVTQLDKEWQVRSALADGIRGYLLQSCTADELVDALCQAAQNMVCLSAPLRGLLEQAPVHYHLTGREREVLQLLATGRCNKVIARDLGIGVGTVKTHLKGLMTKLGATARTHAVVLATQRGLVDQRSLQLGNRK
jgi:two-component system NarL family response regulator